MQDSFNFHHFTFKVTQSCPTLCDPMDYTVHGILQARILEWVAISLLQGIFLTWELNRGLLHCRGILYQLSYQGSQKLQKINTGQITLQYYYSRKTLTVIAWNEEIVFGKIWHLFITKIHTNSEIDGNFTHLIECPLEQPITQCWNFVSPYFCTNIALDRHASQYSKKKRQDFKRNAKLLFL